MEIKLLIDPDNKTKQEIHSFQFRFMNLDRRNQDELKDRYEVYAHIYLVAYEDKQIIATINLFTRKIKFKNKFIRIGGIGGVCTHPKQRHKGIATLLLKEALKALKNKNCDLAFLCTDINKLGKLYSSVDFVPLGRQYKVTGASGKVYLDKGGMIAPVKSKAIFYQVLIDKAVFDLQGRDW